jgi:tellurite resistance protein TerC
VPTVSTNASLVVIVVVLAITTVASLIKTKNDPSAKAHPGSLRANPHSDEHSSPRPS